MSSVLGKRKADDTLSSITQRLFTPSKNERDSNNRRSSKISPKTPRLLKVRVDNDTLKRVKKSNEQYCASGPPKLPENATMAKFHEWQNNLLKFIERLPGYKKGMLEKNPRYDRLRSSERSNLREIYANIYGWLAKAGSENSKVSLKTKNISTSPYADIVSWWKSVKSIYAISNTEMDRKVQQLDDVYQFHQESCKIYFSRFEGKYTEIRDLGKIIHDDDLGIKVYRGFTPPNKRLIQPFMANHNLSCTLQNISDMCKWADELDEDPNPNHVNQLSLAAPLQANLVSSVLPGNNNNNAAGNNSNQGKKSQNNRGGKNKKKKFNNYQNNNNNSSSGLWDPQSSSYQGQQYGTFNQSVNYVSPSNRSVQQNTHSNETSHNHNEMNHPDRRQNINNNSNQQMANRVVPLSNITTPGLTYQVKPNGQHNWFMNGQELVAPALNAEVYNISTPQRNVYRSATTYSNESSSRDMDSRNSLEANLATEVNDYSVGDAERWKPDLISTTWDFTPIW